LRAVKARAKLKANLSNIRHLTQQSARGFRYLFREKFATLRQDSVCTRYERRGRKQQEPSFQGRVAGSVLKSEGTEDI
jgi:hypothetical protein